MPRQVDTVKWNKLRTLPKPKHGTGNGHLLLRYLDPTTHQIASQQGKRMELWVDDVSADFGLTGTTAQSVAKRDFYPRNFNQPAYKFHGQTFNERHYGRLGEFIRWAQLECVFRNGIMQILLPQAGATHVWAGPGKDFTQATAANPTKQEKYPLLRGRRGPRPPIWLEGYVANIKRAHAKEVYSPEWEFSFVVSRVKAGPMLDEEVSPQVLPVNWDSFIQRDGTGFVRDPNEVLLSKENREPPTRIPKRLVEDVLDKIPDWLSKFPEEPDEEETPLLNQVNGGSNVGGYG